MPSSAESNRVVPTQETHPFLDYIEKFQKDLKKLQDSESKR